MFGDVSLLQKEKPFKVIFFRSVIYPRESKAAEAMDVSSASCLSPEFTRMRVALLMLCTTVRPGASARIAERPPSGCREVNGSVYVTQKALGLFKKNIRCSPGKRSFLRFVQLSRGGAWPSAAVLLRPG